MPRMVGMYVAKVPNRNSPPAYLLRESYREGGKVKSKTIANITKWPADRIEAFKAFLKGGTVLPKDGGLEVVRSLPHGHVAAVLGTVFGVGLHRILGRSASRRRNLAIALIVSRILKPASKLATARTLRAESATSTLAHSLGLEDVSQNEMYETLDWLLERKPKIEATLARKHLPNGSLVLYDVTSVWLEGSCCPLGRRGYSRDGKKGKLQIVFGVLCDFDGVPVGVEVFSGNTADPATLATQIEKLRERFGLKKIVMVGDRGLITQARIDEELRDVSNLDWITCLRAPQIKKLADTRGLQLSLFDETDLAELTHPDFPGERLIACRNPLLADERRRKRDELLGATERELAKVVTAVQREKRPLRGKAAIGVRVGRLLGRFKMGKHFRYTIEDAAFRFERDAEKIAAEQALDGIYVIRTSLDASEMPAEHAVETYKRLSVVERAFRCLKTIDLRVRPVYHWTEDRVRAHVFLCMLAYYVEWHLRRSLAPLLFQDDDPGGGRERRESVVEPAKTSESATAKASRKRTPDDYPVHTLGGLLDHLATMSKNWITMGSTPEVERVSVGTRLQERAFELLGVNPRKV